MKKTVVISPGMLCGTVVVPPSKSAAHRALICASLSQGDSVVSNIDMSDDIKATLNALETIGAKSQIINGSVRISSADKINLFSGENIFCNESGSTLRFLIPILLGIGGSFSLSGRGRLMQRPLVDYFRIFDEKGIKYEKYSDRLIIEGKLKSGAYRLAGNVSSQYITGLLFALPLLSGNSEIIITTNTESVGYIDMTLDIMKRFGVTVQKDNDYRHFYIPGNQKYKPCDITIEGDYSQAAFYLVANELGSKVDIKGLNVDSLQGDKEILKIIKKLRENEPVHVINVSQVPDLVPILSVLAAKSNGITRIVGASRLRIKESDRLHAVYSELTKLGVIVNEEPDALEIMGNAEFCGAITDSHNDHRIAMSLAIAATVAEDKVTICGAESVKKSYGDFWDRFEKLGGVIY